MTGTVISGKQAVLELEDDLNRLLHRTVYQNVFWKKMLDPAADIPLAVFHGMCIENYHFLFRESWFDSPALSFPGNTKARVLMNAFYCEELGHDELLLGALESLGLTRADLFETVPLRQTMALCNALSSWARYDPLFFFSTLGPLEGKEVEIDSFVTACERRRLPEAFVGPIRTHAQINKSGAHGQLARKIFDAIPAVSGADLERMRRTTRLFVELYDDFYTAIWEHYATAPSLLRRVEVAA
jgi:heme oxygenase-like protein